MNSTERAPAMRPDSPKQTVPSDSRDSSADDAVPQRAPADLADQYREVRARSLQICAPLAADDYGIQPMPDASPPKWHLAHTTWFFETFLLKPLETGFQPFHPRFEYLFNSYYNAVGTQYPRARRGLMSRPTLAQVLDYRADVDQRMQRLLARAPEGCAERVVLGLAHEEQHQELMLTDLKYNLGHNPLLPAYRADLLEPESATTRRGWLEFDARRWPIGQPAGTASDRATFCFDNETPRHEVSLPAFALAAAPVSNADYLAFVNDGGYRRPELWLSDGWARVQQDNWMAPLYWLRSEGGWQEFTLGGVRELDHAAPVSHVSFYEAEAYARWAGARLPSEFEWEAAAGDLPPTGNFYESGRLHPSAGGHGYQLFGDVWEWTATPYQAYPGFRPTGGALGEYNGKFMCNQMVLRGGSALTASGHVRASYRNFFYPPDRWQMSGFRLARDDA